MSVVKTEWTEDWAGNGKPAATDAFSAAGDKTAFVYELLRAAMYGDLKVEDAMEFLQSVDVSTTVQDFGSARYYNLVDRD